MSTSFNISKGKIQWYWEQAAAASGGTGPGFVIVLLRSTGLQSDAILKDYDNLSVLLAAANDEPTFTNYVRKTLQGANVIVTVNDTTDFVNLDLADQTWVDAGGVANDTVSKVLVCYDPALGTGTDADIVPLIAHDITATTDGNDLIIRFHADGSARVA